MSATHSRPLILKFRIHLVYWTLVVQQALTPHSTAHSNLPINSGHGSHIARPYLTLSTLGGVHEPSVIAVFGQ